MDRVFLGISRPPLARAVNTLARALALHSDLILGGVFLSQLTDVGEKAQEASK